MSCGWKLQAFRVVHSCIHCTWATETRRKTNVAIIRCSLKWQNLFSHFALFISILFFFFLAPHKSMLNDKNVDARNSFAKFSWSFLCFSFCLLSIGCCWKIHAREKLMWRGKQKKSWMGKWRKAHLLNNLKFSKGAKKHQNNDRKVSSYFESIQRPEH